MRPLEVALVVLDLAAILFLALPLARRYRRAAIRTAAACALLATSVAQFTVEGFRWQLAPAYVVAVGVPGSTLLLAALRRRGTRAPAWVGRPMVALALLLVAVSLLAAVLLPVPSLPSPSGGHDVGTTTFDWVDHSRIDSLAPSPTPRELVVQIWYPAARGAIGRRAPYMSVPTLRALAGLLRLPPPSLDYVALSSTDATVDAPLDPRSAPYPLLIFSSGLGSYRTQSTFLMEDLASHGYVVVSIDYPYESAAVVLASGRVVFPNLHIPPGISPAEDRYKADLVSIRLADTTFVIAKLVELDADPHSPFARGIDMKRIGMLGHSLGGATAVAACAKLVQVRACLNMDGELRGSFPNIDRPLMTMKTTNEEYGSSLDRERELARDATLNRSPIVAERYEVTIAKAGHLNFTDIQFMLNPLVRVGSIGSIDGRRCAIIIDTYALAFFNRTLRASSTRLLTGPSPVFPEVEVQIRGPAD